MPLSPLELYDPVPHQGLKLSAACRHTSSAMQGKHAGMQDVTVSAAIGQDVAAPCHCPHSSSMTLYHTRA